MLRFSSTLLCLAWFLNTNFELNRLSDLLLVRVFLFMQILCYCKFLANLPTAAVDGVAASVVVVAAAAGDEGGVGEVPRLVWVCLAYLQVFLKLSTNLNFVNRFLVNGLNGCKVEILYILSLHLRQYTRLARSG